MPSPKPQLQPQSKHRPKPKSKRKRLSFNEGLAGALALLTIIAGIITQWGTISSSLGLKKKKASSYAVEEVSYPDVVPSYLRYYYEAEGLGKQENLHWFRAKMKNKTGERLTFLGTFDLFPINCQFVQLQRGETPEPYVLAGRATGQWEVTPSLIWTKADTADPCFLKFTYSIRDDQGDNPDPLGSVQITLLPRDKIKWDLNNIDRKHVSRDFLLASLAGWSLSNEGTIIERAKRPQGRLNGLAPAQWLKFYYEDLFGQSGIVIKPAKDTYPLVKETTLRSPAEVLSDGNAEPLEAAFLLAAVIHANKTARLPSLTLFILPSAANPSEPSVLLAWSLSNDGTWEAIDVGQAGKLGFETNLQKTSELLKPLTQTPEIQHALTDRGIYSGSESASPIAISFDRAAATFKILPLP
jgi:hypothetical protein